MTFCACSSPAPTPVKPQPAPAKLSQESVDTTLSITHHTRKRPSTGPRTTHGPQNLFPFPLEDEAQIWYTFESVEAKGNWDEQVKKFLLKFFPISRVQDLSRQVLPFKQGEDGGIDEAWDRFNELLEQGLNLGFSSDLMLHTFYFSLTPNSSRFVSMCAGSDLMDKITSEAAQILQRISNGKRMQRIGKVVVGRRKMTKAIPRCLLKFLKNTNWMSRKMNRPYKKLKIHFPR
jgi:hypothetical protein